jgi:predicted ester cyclase
MLQDETPAPDAGPKEVVRRYVAEVQDGHRHELIDELVAPDFVNHLSQVGSVDRETLKQGQGRWLAAFPDQRWTIHHMVAEGDLVATFKTCEGTHEGEWMGLAPTGRQMALAIFDLMRVRDGRIVEHWGTADMADLTRQLEREE